jgi:hypothetical protein
MSVTYTHDDIRVSMQRAILHCSCQPGRKGARLHDSIVTCRLKPAYALVNNWSEGRVVIDPLTRR